MKSAKYWLCNAFELDTIRYPTSHLYFLSIHTRLNAKNNNNQKKEKQVRSGIFHDEALHCHCIGWVCNTCKYRILHGGEKTSILSALTLEIFSLPHEHKIHIFEPTSNVLFTEQIKNTEANRKHKPYVNCSLAAGIY